MLRKFRSVNPFNGQLIKEFDFLTERELLQKIEQSEEGFELNRRRSFIERGRILDKVIDMLVRKENSYAEIITLETGKVISESLQEIRQSQEYVRQVRNEFEKVLVDQRIKTNMKKSQIKREGKGGILQISNYQQPWIQMISGAINGIASGNSILQRCPDSCPLTGLALEELFYQSGLQLNEHQVILSNPIHTPLLIAHPHIAMTTFCGTTSSGHVLSQLSSQHNKAIQLSMSTNNPVLIMSDANLPIAIESIVRCKARGNGQNCNSPQRVIVNEQVLGGFSEMLVKRIQELQIGDPFDSGSELGCISRIDISERLDDQLRRGQRMDDQVLLGGNVIGSVFEPTLVLAGPSSPLVKEEVVGPILAIQSAQDDYTHMLQLANNSDYGFRAALFTQDYKYGEKVIGQLQAGWNESVTPNQGLKQSGNGTRYSIKDQLLSFTNHKTININ